MISRYIKGDDNWREELKRIIAETDFLDQEVREFFVKNNRRKVYEFCNEKEEQLCTTLNKNKLS